MRNIKLSNNTYTFPESWSECTLNQFQQINTLKLEDDFDNIVSMISILSGIDKAILLDLPYTEYTKLVALCSFGNNPVENSTPTLIFTLNGIEYGFRQQISKQTTSEFIDYDTFSKGENVVDNLHIVMAILYRPIITKKSETEYTIEKYDPETVFDRADLFKEGMSADIVMSAMVFSMAFVQLCIEHTRDYSEKPKAKSTLIMKMKNLILKNQKSVKISMNDGGGQSHYTA